MTETKLADSTYTELFTSNPYYYVYISNCKAQRAVKRETSLGTAIAITKPLRPYIHNIITEPGTAIAIDFFFPNKNQIRIISTYLPATNHPLNKITQRTITQWVNQATSKGYHTIVLGDFNIDRKLKKKIAPLFNTLKLHGLLSTLDYFNITDPTWSRQEMNSQIDDIWVPTQLIHNITPPQTISPSGITDSDHQIVQLQWAYNPQITNNRRKQK